MTKEQLTDLISRASDYFGPLDMDSIHPLVLELSSEFNISPSIAEDLIVRVPAQVMVDGIGPVTVPDTLEDDDSAELIREGKIAVLVNRICERT